MKDEQKRIKLLVTIVDRGKGEKLSEIYRENNIVYNIIFLGKGTAKSEILDYLGIGRTDKDIVLSVVQEDNVENIMNILYDELNFKKPGSGVSFTIDINSVDSAVALELISSLHNHREE